MYDSGMTAKALIDMITAEADIALPVSPAYPIMWLNSMEQLIYGELTADLSTTECEADEDGGLFFENESGYADFEVRDVMRVYADGIALKKVGRSTIHERAEIPCWYEKNGKMYVCPVDMAMEYTVIYRKRPVLKTEENYVSETIKLPPEFLEMAAAKLRGEAYKLANEDYLSAKWLTDYNAHIENFKQWCAERDRRYGI